VLDPAGIAISTATNLQRRPEVASNGTNFLVVWEDQRAGSCCDVYGARVSGAGTVLDPAGILISTAGNAPDVASNGTDYLVVWQGGDGARVSSAGSVLDPVGIPITATGGGSPAVVSNGTDFLVVWEVEGPISPPSSYTDIYGSRVSGDGTVVDPDGILMSTAANSQSKLVAASNGTQFLVVWFDSRTPKGIYATRVSGDGTVLDPAGIAISTGADDSTSLAVWSNGTDFLVAWRASGIKGARVSAAGNVLDPAGIAISGTAAGNPKAPAVTWNGTDFLVVWEDSRLDQNYLVSDIFGARVSPAGAVLDPAGIPISTAANNQTAPALAWNGTNFLVVWQDSRSGSNDIYGARVNGAGGVVDPAGVAISIAANGQIEPAVASWNDHFLVVWQDRRSGTNYDIYGTEVSASGTLAQPAGAPISTAAGDQESPDLAVRYHFLVAWRDRRSGTNYDVYAARVSPSGAVEEPAGLLVAGAATNEGAPVVIGGPGTTWRVAYDRFVPESPYGASRVFLRSVSPK
jgi:hypothetical protein